jgi:hypothetical protein
LPDLQQYRRQLEHLRDFHNGKMPSDFSAALEILNSRAEPWHCRISACSPSPVCRNRKRNCVPL